MKPAGTNTLQIDTKETGPGGELRYLGLEVPNPARCLCATPGQVVKTHGHEPRIRTEATSCRHLCALDVFVIF